LEGLAGLPFADDTYVILVSDHVQARIKSEEPFIIETVVSLEGLTVVDHGAAAFLYFPDSGRNRAVEIRDVINGSWTHGHAILRDEAPADWHVTSAAGFADLIVQSNPGYTVYSSVKEAEESSLGDHGWAPDFKDMHGIFLATGPRLPRGVRIPPISVTDVYPLMMEILSLSIPGPIDGDLERLPDLLQP